MNTVELVQRRINCLMSLHDASKNHPERDALRAAMSALEADTRPAADSMRGEVLTELCNASGKFILEEGDRYSISMRDANSLVGACRIAAAALRALEAGASALTSKEG
jgi:hypothetical protein